MTETIRTTTGTDHGALVCDWCGYDTGGVVDAPTQMARHRRVRRALGDPCGGQVAAPPTRGRTVTVDPAEHLRRYENQPYRWNLGEGTGHTGYLEAAAEVLRVAEERRRTGVGDTGRATWWRRVQARVFRWRR